MLYKFKSKAGGDVIMLELAGRQMLAMIGKPPDVKGILLPEQMPAAKAALEEAITLEEALSAEPREHEDQKNEGISLRMRAWPLITLMDHSLKANVPITWGV
jgi:hypothetical protein